MFSTEQMEFLNKHFDEKYKRMFVQIEECRSMREETNKSLAKDDKRLAILNLKTTALLWLVGVIASGIVALVFKIYLGG